MTMPNPAGGASSFTPSAAPAAVGARTRRYDPGSAFYNAKATKLLRSRAKLAASMANPGSGGPVYSQLDIGDSMTAGYPNTMDTGRSMILRKRLASRGFAVADTGYVCGWGNATLDGRWAMPAGWGAPPGNTANYIRASSINQATFTSDINCTSVSVAVLNNSPCNSYNLVVDGTNLGAVALDGTSTVNVFTRTGLAAGSTHTVGIVPANATGLDVVGVKATANNGGVSITNAGIGGAQTAQWTDQTSFKVPTTLMKGLTSPHLVTIMIGYNDINSGKTPSQFTTDMVTLAGLYTAASDVIIIVEPAPDPANVSTAIWNTYQSACYDAADQLDVPLIDITARWGLNSASNAVGLRHTDGIHNTIAGSAEIAIATEALLLDSA